MNEFDYNGKRWDDVVRIPVEVWKDISHRGWQVLKVVDGVVMVIKRGTK